MPPHNVLVKVYGNIYPTTAALRSELEKACEGLLPSDGAGPEDTTVELEGDLLRISYEGVYFPVEDVLALIPPHLRPESQGKIDYIDLENWTLHRYSIHGMHIQYASASLNNVMDYAGL